MEPGLSGKADAILTSLRLASVIVTQRGMQSSWSSSTCALTPPFARRNFAHGNISRHRLIVVESSDSSVCLKRNFRLRAPNPFSLAEPPERCREKFLIQLGGPPPIGISQRGFVRSRPDSEVNQFAHTTGKPVADFSQV